MDQINALKQMPDSTIDYSDIPPVNFSTARWRDTKLYRPVKVQKTFRVDADVLHAFSETGKGYMTLINTVLRDYVDFSSDVVLKEVRTLTSKEDYAGIAQVVNGALTLRPELKGYLPGKVRAAILNQWLRAFADVDLTPVVKEIGRDPEWWTVILEFETDPVRLPKVLALARRKIDQLLAGQNSRPAKGVLRTG